MQRDSDIGKQDQKNKERDRVGQEHGFKERDWTIAVSAASSDETAEQLQLYVCL